MSDRPETPKRCPECGGGFVSETLYGWICADCGATKENATNKKKQQPLTER